MRIRAIIFTAFIIATLVSVEVHSQGKGGKGFAFDQNKRLGRGVNIIGYDPLWKDCKSEDEG